ncbi:hypothetical protein JKF63_02126 [Porcisia hertigi]|uniref:Uncharacterized protein n=1 Tax=Porcisia hertigi TaxID=2761500 RepID=A0A836II61_9TRYP|nr:hypothetical protein JKF63_02126 [Porcisia hertigi]
MRRYRLSRAASLLTPLLVTVLLSLFSSCSTGAPTRESQLRCFPTEAQSNNPIHCVIEVRDGYQKPTVSFDPSDFTIATRASNSEAVVTTSALVRGGDSTTAVFTLFASTSTDVLIRVYLRETSAIDGTFNLLEVRSSGIAVSVLSWPAYRLGPITCTAQSTGLSLRSSSICRSTVYDVNNSLSAVHPADVLLSEANGLGSFVFISGTRELVFRYTAPALTPIIVPTFTLQARLRNADTNGRSGGVQTAQFPLLYPDEVALSATTTLQCSKEEKPMICHVIASDARGPVAFNATHFRVRVERLMETDALSSPATHVTDAAVWHWVDVTETLNLSVGRSSLSPHIGAVSWTPKSNDVIYKARLRVYASTNGQEMDAAVIGDTANPSNVSDVESSPYAFTMGTVPNAHSVNLRGCRESVIISGNTTVCFIDLKNGVSGDTNFYLITTSQRQSFVSNVTYVAHDAVCMCPSLWFTYHAPTALMSRVVDYITVSVYTDVERSANGIALVNTSLHLNVFHQSSSTAQDISARATNTVLVVVGLLFYGSVLGVGGVLIVLRSRKSSRIRLQRALKEQAMLQEMAIREGESDTNREQHLTNNLNAPALPRTVRAMEVAVAAEDDVRVRGGAGPTVSWSDKVNTLNANARGAGGGGGGSDLTAPTLGPTAVVSNMASPQDRFHSDSD